MALEQEEGGLVNQPASLPAEVVPPDHSPGSVPEIRTPGPAEISVAVSDEPGLQSDAWPIPIADVDNPPEPAGEVSENE